MNKPISEKEQEAPEIAETDEVLDFYEFEDEEYLADAAAPTPPSRPLSAL